MKSDHTPIFDSSAEHLFRKTEEESAEESIRKIIEEDPQNAPSIIAKRVVSNRSIEREEEQERVQELIEEADGRVREAKKREKDALNQKEALEKKCRRKNSIIMMVCWPILVVLLMLLFEYVFPEWRLLTVMGLFGEKAIEYFIDFLWNGEKAVAAEKEKVKKPDGFREGIKFFFHWVINKRGLCITAFIVTVCLAAGGLAEIDASEQAAKFWRGGYAALTDSFDAAENMVARGVSAVISWREDMLPPEQPGVTVAVEAKRYLTGSDARLIQRLDNSSITWEDINIVLNLSEEDYNILFFLEGLEPGIYESQEQLNQRVFETVEVYTAAKLENKFDIPLSEGGPSQEILNTISRLSDLEKETIDFSETKDILIGREVVYQVYPKRTLAQLVSNGYHQMALLLFWHGGQEATIVYCYGQSILLGMECLKFADNTGLTVKEKLRFIAQRYEDIAYTCPDFKDAQRARMLAEAFRYAADQY